MLKEFIEYLFDYVKAEKRVTDVEGRKYFQFNNSWKIINPPMPEAISTSGLAGITEYANMAIEANVPKVELTITCDVNTVQVRGVLDPEYQQRKCFLTTSFSYFDFHFGSYYGVEEFIIKMQSQFDDTDDKAKLMQLIGNIKDGQVIQRQDDGITQEVTARVGITRLDNVQLTNPVRLKPKRTFAEVDQVESAFIIRARSGQSEPSFALFEADGGAWQIEAVKRIKDYIRTNTGNKASILVI